MGYTGETYQVPLEQGGFNHNKNIDTIPPMDHVHPSRNIWLNEGGIRKRGGTARVDTDTMGAVSVTGLFDFTLASTNQFIVRATSDGKLWKNEDDTIKTGLTVSKKVHIMQWGDEVYFCNAADIPTVWNGVAAGTTDIGDIPTDWTGTNYPQQMIQHGRGNSLRNWALGCPTTPKTIYVTANGAPKDFSDANVLTFNIETGDGFGVVGGIEFGDRLLLFGKNKSFVIDDTSTDTDEWGYSESQWSGGAAHHRLIVRTPNDIVCMMENGEIYSVTAAQEYGDYKAASLARPSFIHEWIKTYIALGYIADFHAVYDPTIRAIKFFMVRVGETEIDTCLAYFIDRPVAKAWVILGNEVFESGYSALSSAVVRQSAGVWKIYTGSYAGRIWKLGEATRSDNLEAFVSRLRTAFMAFDNARETKRYDKIKIISASEGSCDATITWWIDNAYVNEEDLTFAVDGGFLGTFVLGTDVLGKANILENSVSIGALGKRIQIEAKSSTAGEDFFLSQFLIDFMQTGKRP